MSRNIIECTVSSEKNGHVLLLDNLQQIRENDNKH